MLDPTEDSALTCNTSPSSLQACPGPSITLVHDVVRGMTPLEVGRHANTCPECLARLVRCIRTKRGCSAALQPFSGLPRRRHPDRLRPLADEVGLFELWADKILRKLPWSGLLSGRQKEEVRLDALEGAFDALLTAPQLDPERLLVDGRPLAPYIQKTMENKMRSWRRKNSIPVPHPDPDADNDQRVILQNDTLTIPLCNTSGAADEIEHPGLPAVQPPEAWAEALSEVALVYELVQAHALSLEEPRRFVFSVWIERRINGGELTQKDLAALLFDERKVKTTQSTVSRWLDQSRLVLTGALGDPKLNLSPEVRDGALRLIAPRRHAKEAPQLENES